MVLALNNEIILPENAPVRLTSAQLEELDYRQLYRAYSPKGRKSAADPRRFRKRCAKEIEDLFYQYARLLEEQGETDHETVFIDGTKLESAAGRYTFAWRKNVEKQLAKVKQKVQAAISAYSFSELEEYLAQAAEGIDFVHGSGKRKSAEQLASVDF